MLFVQQSQSFSKGEYGMNRSNPFRFDLRNGIRFIAKKFLVLPLLVSLVCFEFMLRLRETASLNHQYAGAQPTLGILPCIFLAA